MQKQVLMGGTGVGSYNVIYPTVLNSVVGTKFRLVTGYPSTTEIAIAMERGEVQGRAGNNFNSLTLRARRVAQDRQDQPARPGRDSSATRISPAVPLITDFAKTDEDRQILRFFSTDIVIGRPFVTSPGVPAERVALLRAGVRPPAEGPGVPR